jgi:hypothetical protein
METVLHHHDLWIVDSLLMAVETRQFDCGLVRLGARVAEENPGPSVRFRTAGPPVCAAR